jgi:hypothetical protein
MNSDQILALLNKKFPPHIALQEIELRGPDDNVPKTQAFAEQLRLAGATPEFIDVIVPNDEIEIPAPAGYAKIPLVRAEAYDRRSKLGRLLINADISGQVEFLFLHNSLFWKPVADDKNDKAPMGEVKNLGSSFTAPAPRVDEPYVEYEFETIERSDKSKITKLLPGFGKGPRVVGITYEGKGNQRHGFRFTVTETDKQPHTWDIRVRWNVRDTPKPKLK